MLIRRALLVKMIQRRMPDLYYVEVGKLLDETAKIMIRRLLNRTTVNIKGLGVIVRKSWRVHKLFNVNKNKFRVVKPVTAQIIPDPEFSKYISSEPIKSIIREMLITKWAAIKHNLHSYGRKLKATM